VENDVPIRIFQTGLDAMRKCKEAEDLDQVDVACREAYFEMKNGVLTFCKLQHTKRCSRLMDLIEDLRVECNKRNPGKYR